MYCIVKQVIMPILPMIMPPFLSPLINGCRRKTFIHHPLHIVSGTPMRLSIFGMMAKTATQYDIISHVLKAGASFLPAILLRMTGCMNNIIPVSIPSAKCNVESIIMVFPLFVIRAMRRRAGRR